MKSEISRSRTAMITCVAVVMAGFTGFAVAQPTPAPPQTAPEAPPEAPPESPPGPSAPKVEIYGYVKLDAAYDTARTEPGEFVKWVELAPDNDGDDQFTMTANQTRLGIRLSRPAAAEGEEGPRFESRATVEIDFYGGGAANKANPMMRHAFVQLLWPEADVDLILGQTWDVVGPLNPTTLNYPVAWWSGNIGYRRPQVRWTGRRGGEDRPGVELAVALARTIGATDSDFTGNDAGADSGMPTVQTRLGVDFPQGPALGFSAHWGQEEYDLSPAGNAADFDSWSVNIDYRQVLGDRAKIQAELFRGANLQALLGGIGQGVNLGRLQEIGAAGGWVAVDLGPFRDWTLHLGAAIDDVDDVDIETGDRSRNRSLWLSATRALAGHLQLGAEIGHWATEYKGIDEATALRGQFSIIYKIGG